jgi:hypothetical protein
MNKKILIPIIIIILVGGGFFIWYQFIRERQPAEKDIILRESLSKTLELNSVTIEGDAVAQIKAGEKIVFKLGIRDVKTSIINPFDPANQDLSMIATYNARVNLEPAVDIIVDIIKEIMPPEKLMLQEAIGLMDYLEIIREVGQINISATMAMKSIGLDSYMKIVEIEGLREILTQFVGPFMAERIMREIEPLLGVWKKTPGPDDPVAREEMAKMPEKIREVLSSLFEIYYVREVLPDTEIDGVAVYNFALGINLAKARDVIISFIEAIPEEGMIPAEIAEKERTIAIIKENWPLIKKIVDEAMKINLEIYICQETHFTIKDSGSINIDLHKVIEILKPMLLEKTEEEKATLEEERVDLEKKIAELRREIGLKDDIIIREALKRELTFLEWDLDSLNVQIEFLEKKPQIFERIKETIENMSVEWNFRYSQHNAVPPIVPPAEYELI